MNDLISRAERFARVCHEGQFRKGKAKEPYVSHLEEVAKLTERWGE
jgi:(p)ppGpp synthase/HD superfamily hydrolase